MSSPNIDNHAITLGRTYHALASNKHTYADLSLRFYANGMPLQGMEFQFEALLARDLLAKFLKRLPKNDDQALCDVDDALLGKWFEVDWEIV